VLGSALTDRYQASVASGVAHLPGSLAEHAHQALPAALALAHQLGGPLGVRVGAQAQSAFVDGLGVAMLIAAGAAAAAAVFVFWRAPRTVTTRRDEASLLDPRPLDCLEQG
jgi:hypothetical protein